MKLFTRCFRNFLLLANKVTGLSRYLNKSSRLVSTESNAGGGPGVISIKPPSHASQSPRPASPVLAACAAHAPPPDTNARFWVCSAPFASSCRRSLRRLVRPPARRRSRKSRRSGVCRRNGAPTALLRMLAGSCLGVPRGWLARGVARAPGRRGGARARGSLPRGQVGAGSGC